MHFVCVFADAAILIMGAGYEFAAIFKVGRALRVCRVHECAHNENCCCGCQESCKAEVLMHKTEKMSLVLRIGSVFLLAVTLLAAGGCETDPDENKDYAGVDEYFEENPYSGGDRDEPVSADLKIDPVLQMIGVVGGTAVFEGKGGVGPYAWSVSDAEYGTIVSLGWSEAIYTCLKVGNNNVMVVDQEGHSAVASVTPAEAIMTIYPASVDLIGAAYYASFSVSGGTPPYSWTVGNVGMGTISYSSGTTHIAGYTAVPGSYGVNVVTVMDSQGQSASATVTQSSEE